MLNCAMSCYNRTEPPLTGILFVTSDKRRVRRCVWALQRTSTSAATVMPALDPGSKRGIAVLNETAGIYRGLITYNKHCAEPVSIQVMDMSENKLHNGVWRAVMRRKGRRWQRRIRVVHDDNISKKSERK